jgi:spermidine synthase
VQPWERIARATAPDGATLELRRRGHEYLILAGGHDLMSSEDEGSSRALADLGCAHLGRDQPVRVLVGGLGMGYTLRAALDRLGPTAAVEVAELVPAVVDWNRGPLADLAGRPLDDRRTHLHVGDVGARIRAARGDHDAILLDVDNGPDALAHAANDSLYSPRGLAEAWEALRPGGVLAVWSFSDDDLFTRRLERQGFAVKVHRVSASRKGRGRFHVVWVAVRPARARAR